MKDRIKVLLVSPYSKTGVGGIGTWTKLMLDYCEERDDIYLFFQNTASKFDKRSSLKNTFSHLYIGCLDSFSIIRKLVANMFKYKPDVVHYTSSAGLGLYKDIVVVYIVRYLFRKSIIIHWRFGRIPELGVQRNKEWTLLKIVVRKATASIVIDENSLNTLRKEGFTNVINIPNPISGQLEILSRNLNLEELHNQREKGTVLYVGHVLKTKGITELIEATKDNPLVSKLIVIGPFFDETFKRELQELAIITPQKADWISWEGELEREKVFGYYKKCAVFCLPSYTEGFPNSVMEAMAFACPIVATKVGAIPEMLSDGCGLLTEVQAVEQLQESIDKVLSNQKIAKEMGERAHDRVLERYTIDVAYKRYYEIWNRKW